MENTTQAEPVSRKPATVTSAAVAVDIARAAAESIAYHLDTVRVPAPEIRRSGQPWDETSVVYEMAGKLITIRVSVESL